MEVRGPHDQILVRRVEVPLLRPGSRVPQVSILRPGSSAVRVIEGDAMAMPLPDGPVVLFYFNSFEREMTEIWLARASVGRARSLCPSVLLFRSQPPSPRPLPSTHVTSTPYLPKIFAH